MTRRGRLVFKGKLKPAIEVPKKFFSCHDTRTPLKCKGIQACLGFQIPRHVFRIPLTEFLSLMVGLQSLLRFQIPKPTIPDSTSKTSRIPESSSKTSRIPDSTSKTSQIPDSTSKASRSAESGFPYMGRSVPGVTLKDWGQQNLWNLPTQRNKAAWCSSQAAERGYRLLCGVFNRESWSTPVMAFSQANLFSKPRIKKFVKSHKPVRKTYTDLKMLFPSIERLVFLFPSPLTLFKIRS